MTNTSGGKAEFENKKKNMLTEDKRGGEKDKVQNEML